MAQNLMNNNALQAFKVPAKVYDAIRDAAAKTGVNFTYLMEKAAAESGFDANAKAKTSSATGLFQFIESTWLGMVKDHGDKYGLSKYADKISDDGRVRDSKARAEILNLRKDPEIASLMAAEFANGNMDYLQKHVGGDISKTDLYLAHFLGAGGAAGFLNAMKKNPNMTGADLFPKESRSNRTVFYDAQSGAPRSLREIHAYFERKFDAAPLQQPTMVADKAVNLRVNTTDSEARGRLAAATRTLGDDPFERLATLMGTRPTMARPESMLRLGTNTAENNASQDWQIFPPSLYGRLSLSPAQMMLLTDFSA